MYFLLPHDLAVFSLLKTSNFLKFKRRRRSLCLPKRCIDGFATPELQVAVDTLDIDVGFKQIRLLSDAEVEKKLALSQGTLSCEQSVSNIRGHVLL